MAQEQTKKKTTQLSLEEYNKIKEKQAKSKLKLHFPWTVKFFLIFPALYLIFLVAYYLLYIRFVAQR